MDKLVGIARVGIVFAMVGVGIVAFRSGSSVAPDAPREQAALAAPTLTYDEAHFVAALAQHGTELYTVAPAAGNAASAPIRTERLTVSSLQPVAVTDMPTNLMQKVASMDMPNVTQKVASMAMPNAVYKVASPSNPQRVASMAMPNVVYRVAAPNTVYKAAAMDMPNAMHKVSAMDRARSDLQYAIAALDMPSVTYRVSEMESDPVGLARPR